MQQRKVIHVERAFSNGKQHTYFGSLTALFLMHSSKLIGVSKSTLDRHDFDAGPFENEQVIVRLGTLHTPGALRKELEAGKV